MTTCGECVPCEGGCGRTAYCLAQPGTRPCSHDRALCDDCRMVECAACRTENAAVDLIDLVLGIGQLLGVGPEPSRCRHCGRELRHDDHGWVSPSPAPGGWSDACPSRLDGSHEPRVVVGS